MKRLSYWFNSRNLLDDRLERTVERTNVDSVTRRLRALGQAE